VDKHTVYILVGPSGCGKSHLANSCHYNATLNAPEFAGNVVVLSSDDIRRELLCQPRLQKYDDRMMQVSKAAFNELYNRLRNHTTFPVNTPCIFIDTTGLNETFRKEITEIARSNHYRVELIIFDYKDRKEYFKYLEDLSEYTEEAAKEVLYKGKRVTDNHIKRMREDFWKTLHSRDYDKVHKLTRFEQVDKWIEEFSKNNTTSPLAREVNVCDSNRQQLIIGDVQGCLDTLLDLLRSENLIDSEGNLKAGGDTDIVFLGDVIDKGPKSKETLAWILRNRFVDATQRIFSCIGNHEAHVYRVLTKEHVWSEAETSKLAVYFDSVKKYEGDLEFFALLEDYMRSSKEFVTSDYFIATHAPCENRFLAKTDEKALKAQRNFMYTHLTTSEDLKEALSGFASRNADRSYPYVFHGHVALKDVNIFANRTTLDTGAVYGNKLSGCLVYKNNKRIVSVPTNPTDMPEVKEELFSIYERKEKKVDLDNLEPREFGRIMYSAEDKVNFIANTMSPSSANIEDNDIESVRNGLKYFEDNGIEYVHVQKKYMGSNAVVYVNKDISKMFMTSRKGYKISRLYDKEGVAQTDFTEFFKKILEMPKIVDLYKKYPMAETIVINAELVPWFALGVGLIEDTYGIIAESLETELGLLEGSGFEEKLSQLTGIEKIYNSVSQKPREEQLKVLNQNQVETVRNLKQVNFIDVDIQHEQLKIFKQQIELFGRSGEWEIKPFSLLKVVMEDGQEFIPGDRNPERNFKLVSDDESWVVGTSQVAELEGIMKTVGYVDKMEGLCLKPILPEGLEMLDVIPAMKIRNTNYLTLIYGYDYKVNEKKFRRLLETKTCKKKMRISRSEYDLGQKLLAVPMREISKDNEEYKQIVANILLEEREEATLDPRL